MRLLRQVSKNSMSMQRPNFKGEGMEQDFTGDIRSNIKEF